jgi:hypothetical protein
VEIGWSTEIKIGFVQRGAKPSPLLVRFGAGNAFAEVVLDLETLREIELTIEIGLDEVSGFRATHG